MRILFFLKEITISMLNLTVSNRKQEIQMTEDNTPVGRPNIYVKSLTFNDETCMNIDKNDIVVFVGPNNVGKSQTLKDIYALAEGTVATTLVKQVVFSTDPIFPVSRWLSSHFICKVGNDGSRIYSGLDFSFYELVGKNSIKQSKPSFLTKPLFCKLETENRLRISNPPDQIDFGETPQHPIHILQQRSDARKKIARYFENAFGISLNPFDRFGKHIPLVLGPKPVLKESFDDEIERGEKVDEILRTYPHLENQGDGMRSFAGLMLYLIIDHYNVFLIDEPESFLHPPQARLMGEIVGDLLADKQQAFVSTHSIHFIQGLLAKIPNRVKVVRITRAENTNTFSILDNDRLLELSKDPFLKHSDLLEGLFYKNVVLCEADSDCMFYSMINGASDMKGPKGFDTQFVHCGGKQRMSSVVQSLMDLKIPFHVIPDFDIFNNEETLTKLVKACGGDWSLFEREFKVLSNSIRQRMKNDVSGKTLSDKILAILSSEPSAPVSGNKKDAIRKLLDETKSEWDRLKDSGVNGISSGDAQIACCNLLQKLNGIGIHVVPCGELERFVPDCGGHGPEWIQNVVARHPDTLDSVFEQAKTFVRSWNL